MAARFIDSCEGHPHWNMAVDEALLDLSPAGFTLRFYAWSPPGLSLGYFQRASRELAGAAENAGYVVTRRLTGGGAILHAAELTYSLVAPEPRGGSRELYALANGAIVSTLRSLGAPAEVRGGKSGGEASFLCFDRHADFDVTLKGVKVAGSAQRRSLGRILQHGSIVLAGPPPVPGFGESPAPLEPYGISYGALAEALAVEFGRAMNAELEQSALSSREESRASALVETRYSTLDWIQSR